MINLLEIEPNKVPVDPKRYSIMLYGQPKSGKTTFIQQLFGDRVLFIGTEQRHDAIPGIRVQHITTWAEYLQVLAQLRQPAVKELFDVICIDTVANLYGFLEVYIKAKHGVQNIGAVPYGAGWGDLKNEWAKGVKSIEDFGYTPAFIFHSKDEVKLIPSMDVGEDDKKLLQSSEGVTIKKDKDTGKIFYEVNRVTYDAANRIISPINKMVDNIMYIDQVVNEKGDLERVLRLRGSMFYDAGSTFANIEDTIPLDPEAYKEAVKKAVESNGDDNIVREDVTDRRSEAVEYNFDELMLEAKELGVKIFNSKDEMKQKQLTDIVESNFGAGNKLTDATPKQVENLFVAVQEMKKLV